MSFDNDGLGLLGGSGDLSQNGNVLQQAMMGNGKRNRRGPKAATKVTYVVSKQVDGSFAATASLGGGLLGGGKKKQFVAGSLGELLTQLGASARKTFTFGAQPQAVQVPQQQYPQGYGMGNLPYGAPQPRPQVPVYSLGPQAPAQGSAKTCQKCGGEVPGPFCPNCGTKYEAPKVVKAFCTGCGAPVAGLKFCGACGTPAAQAPTA